MEGIITKEMTVREIAKIIFENFEINQSCKVEGTVIVEGRLYEKGKAVLNDLDVLDQTNNTYNGKRKRVRPKESVGGDLAHKIFRYARRIVNDEIRYTIWRMQ